MSEMAKYAPNTFCWAELSTFDVNAAKHFYSELFGWAPVDIPIGDGSTYTMLNIKDKPAVALYTMRDDEKNMGVPPNWMAYINVSSVDETIAKTREFGGTVVLDAMDAMDAGRFGLIQDPDGAYVGLWEPKNHIGSSWWNEHGALCWVENHCHSRATALPFFEKVFGWTGKTDKMGEMDYTVFYQGENMVCGLFELPPPMKEQPPHWLSFFSIDDIKAANEKIIELNGTIMMPGDFVENVGTVGVFQDDQGAYFGLVQGIK